MFSMGNSLFTYLSDTVRPRKQQTVYHKYNCLTKLLPNYRPHVSAYKSHHHPSNVSDPTVEGGIQSFNGKYKVVQI